MSSRARSIRLEGDQERLRLWRLERQKIAELERQKRLAEKEREKERKKQEAEAEISKSAADRIPTEADLEQATIALHRSTRARHRNFILQLLAVILLPLLALGYYLFWVATPLFEAKAVISFQDFETPTAQSSLASLAGPSRSSLNLAFAADAYIGSQAMVAHLENRFGTLTDVSSDAVDPLQRVWPGQWFLPQELQQFGRFVDSYVDVQTGFLTLSVKMVDPSKASQISNAIITEIQNRVRTDLQDRTTDAISSANAGLESAEAELRNARSALVRLQSEFNVVDPIQRFNRMTQTIATLEEEVADLDLQIRRAQIAGRETRVQTQQSIALRETLSQEIETLQDSLVTGEPSLTEMLAQFQGAMLEIELAERRLNSAQEVATDISASNRLPSQQLAIVVPIRTTGYAVYPRKLSTLLTALVILAAIFFFARLTIFRPRPDFG